MSYQAAGWQGYKIHPFRIWRDDMKICRAVREAVGDGFPLMLDSTWGYDYPQALRVGKLIEELDFEWYEDPLGDQDIYNYTKLRQQLRIPILATEFPDAWYDSFAPWIYNQATDYLRGDVVERRSTASSRTSRSTTRATSTPRWRRASAPRSTST